MNHVSRRAALRSAIAVALTPTFWFSCASRARVHGVRSGFLVGEVDLGAVQCDEPMGGVP